MAFKKASHVNAAKSIFIDVHGNRNQIQVSQPERSHVETFDQFCNRRVAGAAFNSAQRSPAPQCLPNTRVDVRERIAQWSIGVHDRPICWLRGPDGSGKSAIAQSIAEECDKNKRLAASFFFDRESSDRCDITDFVPTITYQLSITVPQTKALMLEAFERDPSIPDQTRQDQLEKLIIDPLLKLGDTVSPKIIVVDALDQGDGESWVKDLIILLVGACRNDQLPLRFCLTSRSDAVLFEGVMQCGTYSLALGDFNARDDIRTFFQEQFPTRYVLDGIRKIGKPWPSPSDLDRLVAKSSGLFKSASSIVEFVNDGRDFPYLRLQTVLTGPDGDYQPAAACAYPQELVVDHLVPILDSGDPSTQESALKWLESLTMLGGARVALKAKAILPLVELLKLSDVAVLYRVCRILDNITMYTDLARAEAFNANAIPALVSQLSSKDTRVQRSAMLALKNITLHAPALAAAVTLDAIPTLIGLSSHDVIIQVSAVTVLGRIAAHDATKDAAIPKVIPYLIELLQSKNVFVLTEACEVLVDITLELSCAQADALDAKVIHPLICLLCSENNQVQKSATFTLMSLTLHDPAKTAAIQLGAIPNLVLLLDSDDTSIQASAAAVLENITVGNGAVDAIEANTVPALVKLLTSDNTVVLIAVCAALKNITSTFDRARAEALTANAVGPLIHLLSSRDVPVQKAAAFALMNITLHEPAEHVALASGAIRAIAHLLGSDDIHIQASAAAVLENITLGNGAVAAVEANTIPSLVKLLTSGNPVVLIATCAALRNITSVFDRARVEALNANAIPPLVHLLSSRDVPVQKAAAFALMNITLHEPAKHVALASGAIPAIARLLGSDDISIQASAATVLETTTYQPARAEALDAHADTLLEHLLLFINDRVQELAKLALQNIRSDPIRTSAPRSGAILNPVPQNGVSFLAKLLKKDVFGGLYYDNCDPASSLQKSGCAV